jgi:hypothetical protein
MVSQAARRERAVLTWKSVFMVQGDSSASSLSHGGGGVHYASRTFFDMELGPRVKSPAPASSAPSPFGGSACRERACWKGDAKLSSSSNTTSSAPHIRVGLPPPASAAARVQDPFSRPSAPSRL